MCYRVKQFLRGIFGRLSPADWQFIASHLAAGELSSFRRLSRPDQVHSVCVARKVAGALAAAGQEDPLLLRAALLHDLGKIGSGLNVFNRSLFVLADRFWPAWRQRFGRCRAVRAHCSHPELAMVFLPAGDEDLKNLVRHHHQPDAADPRLRLLQEMDSQC